MESKTFWNLLFLCCILSSPTILSANNPTILPTNCPAELVVTANPIRICGQRNQLSPAPYGNCPAESISAKMNTDNGCRDGIVELSAYTTNLIKGAQRGMTYTWPAQYPDLHLEWEYDPGVFVTSAKLNSWTYTGDNSDGYPIFECPLDVVPLLLEGSYECANSDDPEIYDMNVKIMTPTGTGYGLYPIHNYNGPHDIFSCRVFTETCSACSPATGGLCVALLDPIYDIDVCIDCSPCGSSASPGTNGDKASTMQAAAVIDMQVQPNPFSNQTNLIYDTTRDGAVKISIYNAQGRQLSLENQTSYSGKNTFALNLAKLPNGIYYIEVADGININVERVVKLQ